MSTGNTTALLLLYKDTKLGLLPSPTAKTANIKLRRLLRLPTESFSYNFETKRSKQNWYNSCISLKKRQ